MSRAINWFGPRAGVVAGLLAFLSAAPVAGQDAERGKVVYDKWCAGCHGETGEGDGEAAAYMLPRPRDFTRALYQIRTTASGELPSDDDLRRMIDDGMPGTSMPGWNGHLSSGERDDVIAYIKSFSRFFEDEAPPPIEFSSDPGFSEDDLAEGRRLFREETECLKCHGESGRGDGKSASTLADDWDFPIFATDLTEPWNFNGGSSVEDIYRRMRTGLDGTPMPSYSDALEAEIITDEQLWLVAHYVKSLAPQDQPRVRDVVRAPLAEQGMPSGPQDPLWDGVERYFIPMVGQIIEGPRQFIPGIDGLWIQAIHDGERLAMRITWSDRTESPDPEWDEFYQLLRNTVTGVDGPLPESQGPDRLVMQLPLLLSEGMALPYFLGGDRRRLVSEVVWTNASGLSEGTGAGLGTHQPSNTSMVTHGAAFSEGQWQLQLDRSLLSADLASAPSLPQGVTIPIAFRAADGSQGEGVSRGSVSAWYAIYLDVP
ncbi:MAG: c-type cytochrome, partial [Gemmatimonadota bacterium]